MRTAHNSRARFLARGSILILAALSLWWFALLNPALGLLRLSGEWTLRLLNRADAITADSGGDWTVVAPVAAIHSRRITDLVPKSAGLVAPRSIQLKVSRRTLSLFTLSVPLYWAFLLAAPLGKSVWRALAVGTAALAAMAPLLLAFHVSYTIGRFLESSPSRAAWFLPDVIEYLVIGVVPYMAPLLVALALHAGLRAKVISMADPSAAAGSD